MKVNNIYREVQEHVKLWRAETDFFASDKYAMEVLGSASRWMWDTVTMVAYKGWLKIKFHGLVYSFSPNIIHMTVDSSVSNNTL